MRDSSWTETCWNKMEVEYSGNHETDKAVRKFLAELYSYVPEVKEYLSQGKFDDFSLKTKDLWIDFSENSFLIEDNVLFKCIVEDPAPGVMGGYGTIQYIEHIDGGVIDSNDELLELFEKLKENCPDFIPEWYQTKFYGEETEKLLNDDELGKE